MADTPPDNAWARSCKVSLPHTRKRRKYQGVAIHLDIFEELCQEVEGEVSICSIWEYYNLPLPFRTTIYVRNSSCSLAVIICTKSGRFIVP